MIARGDVNREQRYMADPVQENSLAGNGFKKKIAESQSGLTNITLFFVYFFLNIVYFLAHLLVTFCLIHYIIQN